MTRKYKAGNTKILNKWFIALLMIVPFFLIITNTQASGAFHSSTNKINVKESYLFVQSAQDAEILKNSDNTYTITLKHISPFITYFSDRPARKAGTLTIDKFIAFWDIKAKDGFKADPPNAVLNAIQVGALADDIVFNFPVELTQPIYDKERMTITYTAKSLNSDNSSSPVNGHLKHVTVFIDDACLSCWGQ